jgi:CheY-like chemotaxis protein
VVGNALKFTDRGEVSIRVDQVEQCDPSAPGDSITLRIQVRDTGVGIAPEDQARIFESFTQSQSNLTRRFGGTGLGLTITRRLVEMMNSKIEVESEPDLGSTFTFTFPNVKIAASSTDHPHDTIDAKKKYNLDQFRAARILIVDDIRSNRDLLAGYFRTTAHQLSFACNGEDAIRRAQTDRPDVILMDLRMPEMDGREATKQLKSMPRTQHVPVIFITASVRQKDELNLRGIGAGLLRKPVSYERLFRALEAVLPIDPTRSIKSIDPSPNDRPRSPSDQVPASPPALPEPDAPDPVSFPPLSAADKAHLAQQFDQISHDIWSPLLHVLDIDGLEHFAKILTTLAQTVTYAPLDRYSKTLNQQLDDFDWESLPQTIADFVILRDSLD